MILQYKDLLESYLDDDSGTKGEDTDGVSTPDRLMVLQYLFTVSRQCQKDPPFRDATSRWTFRIVFLKAFSYGTVSKSVKKQTMKSANKVDHIRNDSDIYRP